MLTAIGHAVTMSFTKAWEILWALILGFGLSAVIHGGRLERGNEQASSR